MSAGRNPEILLSYLGIRRCNLIHSTCSGDATLTADEMAGYMLFNGKGNCNSCHVDGRSTLLTSGQTDNGNQAGVQPLFTLPRLCQ